MIQLYLVPLMRLKLVGDRTQRMLTPEPMLTTMYGYGFRKSNGFFSHCSMWSAWSK